MNFGGKRLKIMVGACLTVSMLFGLTSCGSTEPVEGQTSGWGEDNAALAKEFVYAEQPILLPEIEGNFGILEMEQINGSIYAICEVYGNAATPQSKYGIISMGTDGSDSKFVEIQMDNADTSLAEADYAGVTYFTFSGNANLFGMKEYYQLEEDSEFAETEVLSTSLCCWGMDGSLLWEQTLDLQQEDERMSSVWKLLPTENGVGVVLGGMETEMLLYGPEGVQSERKVLATVDRTLADFSDILMQNGDTYLYTYIDEKQNSIMWMNTYDMTGNTVGESRQLPESFRSQMYIDITAGKEVADIVYTTEVGVFSVTGQDAEVKQIMSFINSDVPTTNMNQVLMLDESRFIGCYFDDFNHAQKASLFTKMNPEDVKDKTVLVLAGYSVPYDVKKRVIEFNKTNQEYRVVIQEYSTYDTAVDGMAGYTRLNMDILGRGLPDILIADSYFPVSSYIDKGLVADIGEMIAADPELSQKSFMENVFDAYRVDGKLYYVIPSFSVRTLVGKTSVVGDRSTWTMQEMRSKLDELPEGTQVIGELTKSEFIDMMMQYCGNDFVDVETGKCEFDTEHFVQMLEFAKTLPEEINWEELGEDYWETESQQYRDGRTLLAECNVSNTRYVNDYINGYFGEDISYVGFPTDSGNGAVVEASEQYLISAKSENKEGAWEFVRYYLTDEYQQEVLTFPVDKEIFEERAMEATQNPYYFDEMGKKVEYESKLSVGGESIVLPNMTKEQVTKFVDFVGSIDKCVYYDEDIQAIISEEAASFFAGQKTAQEVAKVIQSRVEIYVSESR